MTLHPTMTPYEAAVLREVMDDNRPRLLAIAQAIKVVLAAEERKSK